MSTNTSLKISQAISGGVMRKKYSKDYFIPVMDCSCGKKDVILSTKGPWCKEGLEDVNISFCPYCDRVPYDESEIKGYISIKELEAMGYTQSVVICDEWEEHPGVNL